MGIFSKAAPQNEKRKRGLFPFVGRMIRRVCIVLGALVLISFITSAFIAARVGTDRNIKIPDQAVLYFKIDGAVTEYDGNPAALGGGAMNIRMLVDAIDRAASDKRIVGMLAEMDEGIGDMAHLDEVRAAILRFRESGKFAYLYAESFEDSMSGYYLATAFPEIWMQPMGLVSITGINAEMPYFKSLMDKIGIEPNVVQRKEYKSLFENLERDDMSAPSREAMAHLVADIINHQINGIAQARGIERADMMALVDRGFLLDQEALEAGLIDHLDYKDVLGAKIRESVTGDPDDYDMDFIEMEEYAAHVDQKHKRALKKKDYPKVALIHASGNILPGDAQREGIVSAELLARIFRETARDESVEAIIVRVNSPGGSPSASETIRRGVVYAREKGKKVYVSMGSAAASGGYWLSTDAERIYTMPMTLTGSIGVVSAKMVLAELWNKIGVHWDGVSFGEHSTLWSINENFSESGLERVNMMADMLYDGFVARVAAGRNMPPEQVEQLARGRVWSGLAAVENGLADRIGGLDVVLDDVAQELGRENRFQLHVEVMPKPRSALEVLMELLSTQMMMGEMVGVHKPALETMSKWMGMASLPPVRVHEPLTIDAARR